MTYVTCQECGGEGGWDDEDGKHNCPGCGGWGHVQDDDTPELNDPYRWSEVPS